MAGNTSDLARDPSLLADFLAEAEEHLCQVDDILLELEKVGWRPRLCLRAMGALHSVKGSAGYLGLLHIQTICHAGEELLIELQSGHAAQRAQQIDRAFELVTQLRTALRPLRPR